MLRFFPSPPHLLERTKHIYFSLGRQNSVMPWCLVQRLDINVTWTGNRGLRDWELLGLQTLTPFPGHRGAHHPLSDFSGPRNDTWNIRSNALETNLAKAQLCRRPSGKPQETGKTCVWNPTLLCQHHAPRAWAMREHRELQAGTLQLGSRLAEAWQPVKGSLNWVFTNHLT